MDNASIFHPSSLFEIVTGAAFLAMIEIGSDAANVHCNNTSGLVPPPRHATCRIQGINVIVIRRTGCCECDGEPKHFYYLTSSSLLRYQKPIGMEHFTPRTTNHLAQCKRTGASILIRILQTTNGGHQNWHRYYILTECLHRNSVPITVEQLARESLCSVARSTRGLWWGLGALCSHSMITLRKGVLHARAPNHRYKH